MTILPGKIFPSFFNKLFRRKCDTARVSISEDSIIWGYRIFLDRDPENFQVINDKMNRIHNTKQLREEFMKSEEFRYKSFSLKPPSLSGNEPPMFIEDVQSEKALQDLFGHIQDSWKHLGEEEPYWSVITSEKFLSTNIRENERLFYDSGKFDVDKLFNSLIRNGINYDQLKSCSEYGCGLGRVTRWLAERFETVYGYDISQTHLNSAERYLDKLGMGNVILKHVKQVRDIQNLPQVDLVYSIIVLQHNPPPLIKIIIREFIKSLNPGGIAFFQVPTYRLGYNFSLKQYLSEATKLEMEMHVLPQSQIFEVIRQEGGKVIEVIEDAMTGLDFQGTSNTFLIQKS